MTEISWMRKEEEELERAEMTSLTDIIFQLMIFFLVVTSVLPATKASVAMDGNLPIGTPKQGGSRVGLVIQLHQNPTTGKVDYYVLQGNDNSAEFYNTIERSRQIIDTPLLENIGRRYQVLYDLEGLKDLISRLAVSQPKVLIRADRKMPYGEVVLVTSILQSAGINKYGWVGGTLKDLQAKIIKTQPKGGGV